jgi:hypothetical protein
MPHGVILWAENYVRCILILLLVAWSVRNSCGTGYFCGWDNFVDYPERIESAGIRPVLSMAFTIHWVCRSN